MQRNTYKKKITPIIIGPNGWLGKAAQQIAGQWQLLDKPVLLGSGKMKREDESTTIYPLLSYADALADLPIQNEYIILNFAYLTKDKVNMISDEDYTQAVKSINNNVARLIQSVKPLAFLFMSSGAAAMVEKGFVTSHDLFLYGKQKIDDEAFFGDICLRHKVKYLAPRLFNIGGPFINKLNSYVLSNFILQSLSYKQIFIKAKHPTYRSYCHVFDLLNLLFAEMICDQKLDITPFFEVGGNTPLEMADLAQIIAKATKLSPDKILRNEFNPSLESNFYAADNRYFKNLLAHHCIPQTSINAIVSTTLDYITDNHFDQIEKMK
jgi:nucleoside-diphosphate-sugar epimerase